jgi:glycosyltransferase 2 family protein
MRRVIPALILLLALYLVLSRFTEVEQIVDTLKHSNPLWIGLAVIVQAVWTLATTSIHRYTYRLLDMDLTEKQLLPVVVASNFINIVAPSGGVGGVAIFVNDARYRGLSAPRVGLAGVLYVLFEYFSFLCILAVGLAVLFRRNHLTGVELGATAVLLLITLVMAGLLVLGASRPAAFERVLRWSARTVNRLVRPILRREYLSETRAHEFALETSLSLQALRAHPREYVWPAAASLAARILHLVILALTFLAFDVPFSVGTLIAGYSIGHLFVIVSPTPAGLGVVEGVMTLALTTLGVTLGAATVITLAFRALTFWLPFFYGFLALRWLERRWKQQTLENSPP